jgi:hypothetical protein
MIPPLWSGEFVGASGLLAAPVCQSRKAAGHSSVRHRIARRKLELDCGSTAFAFGDKYVFLSKERKSSIVGIALAIVLYTCTSSQMHHSDIQMKTEITAEIDLVAVETFAITIFVLGLWGANNPDGHAYSRYLRMPEKSASKAATRM